MKKPLKCTKDCLIVFWLSICAMIFITVIEAHVPSPQLISQDSIIVEQLVQDTIKKVPEKKVTEKELKKQLEYEEYQERQERIDENMMRMEQQSIMMDSLLGKKDTINIER
jgi:hypothetical protein